MSFSSDWLEHQTHNLIVTGSIPVTTPRNVGWEPAPEDVSKRRFQ